MNERTAMRDLWRIKVICRWSLGLVWIWEGLVPKMLWPTAMQRELVLRSGLYWPDPDRFLWALGAAMIAAGVVLCAGWLERWTVAAATLGMTMLIMLVTGYRPESLSDMHGGIPKDLCLAACAWAVWLLAPLVPRRP